MRNERVTVMAHFDEHGSVLGGTQQGICQGFSIELSLEGDQSVEEIAELIRMSHRMCFTESALTREVTVTTRHMFNGQELELDHSRT